MTIPYNQFSYVTRLVLGMMKSKSQKAEQVPWNFKSKSDGLFNPLHTKGGWYLFHTKIGIVTTMLAKSVLYYRHLQTYTYLES